MRLLLPEKMEFLMQPISRTVLEDVNDSEIPLEPHHYLVMAPPSGELTAMSASSADAQICAAEVAPEAPRVDTAQASEQFIENPKIPGCTRRVRIGAAEPGRKPCPNRISAMEISIRGFAENPGDNVIVPKLGTSFDTLGEAYDFLQSVFMGERLWHKVLKEQAKRADD
ncbi:hypothetical protein ACQJBY_037996 [Aegilops geniculata]